MEKKLMTAQEFIEIALEIAESDTAYAKGCWGQELTQKLLDAKRGQSASMKTWYNAKSKVEPELTNYQRLSGLVGTGCRAYDCVCLIKGIGWGSRANKTGTYASHGVADVTADTLYKATCDQTTPDKAIPGMVLHASNHVGIYIGEGKVVEAAPSIGKVGVTDISYQRWTGAGKLAWIDYDNCAGATSGSSASSGAALDEGDLVTIRKGAKYGGAAKGKAVPVKYTDGDVFTISKIQTNNGRMEALLKELTSWVPVSSLMLVEATPTPTTEKRTVGNCSYLNVRSGPGTSYKIVKVLKAGAAVEVQETSGSWARIGTDQWVSGKYLR
ncbi:MAG: SH3 domain-containing protein [Lachnospiraceae bacterium]|nr:SH3 domain-containing protein [Lachnospiraceae bacterium]